ncbi:uncharacterized protein LOC124313028 [Daphnia pulicaria]|uniref:uncharacterized protein LOC124313028 n=1 Tax=Daphnia pulicaria TaxID=35523 RepID=UPI001EEA9ABA|nr:uncharacterized protein LOC124313028 [Daphnia pulicaria]
MTSQVLTGHDSTSFDIIRELHRKQMVHVLHLIFKYLDEDAVANAELTSKNWRAAISDGNSDKLWNDLLHKKMSMSVLWERLHFNFPHSLNLASSNCLSSRELFNKTKFTAKTLRKSVLLFECTRDFVEDSVNVEGIISYVRYCLMKSFLISEKYIALKWKSEIKIWNRHSLKIEEILEIDQKQCLQNFKFVLYDNALFYTHDQQINLRNLVTKKTEEHKPHWMNPTNYINYLFTSNGFLVIGVYIKKQKHFFHKVVVWEIKTSLEMEWENFHMIPIDLDDYETSIDHRFVIFSHRNQQSRLTCDVRKMSDPRTTEKVLTFVSEEGEDVSYKDGFLIITNLKADIMVVDVESGLSRIILQADKDFAKSVVTVSIHSDYMFFMCDYVDESSVLITKMQVWDLQAIKSAPTDTPLQPFCAFEESEITFMGKAVTFRADMFGLVFVTVSPTPQYLVDSLPYIIRVVNFLPTCNFCKQIKKKLWRCGRCKSAKYCDGVCQSADWHHHKVLCNTI